MADLVADLVPSPQALIDRLAAHDYLADEGLANALFCAVRLPQPLLLEGEAGVGKTQAAKALAQMLNTPLIRLQCFEGIDAAEALYEWNYPRQLLGIRLAEAQGSTLAEQDLFAREYLIERPLLQALEHDGPFPAVLLIDEVDRSDEEFEAFLFEMLAESAVTVPEIGTLTAKVPPIVILTSNRTRDLHDALKRRCLYHWIDYPDLDQATRIVQMRVPDAPPELAAQIAGAVQRLRSLDVQKPPGIAEAIDWLTAALLLGLTSLTTDGVERTMGSVLKYREDQDVARDRGLEWVAGG
jgi:MoxR-like ATPase